MYKLSNYKSQSGFSLIELSIILVVFAIFITSLIKATNETSTQEQQKVSITNLYKIKTALAKYKSQNGFYPCPADLILSPSNQNFGKALGTNTGTCSATNKYTADSGSNKVVIGAIPVKDLGLPSKYMADTWNNRIMYIVQEYQTNALQVSTPSSIVIVNKYDSTAAFNPATQPSTNIVTDKADYVLISYGADGVGAVPYSGQSSLSRITAVNSDSNSQTANHHISDDSFTRLFLKPETTLSTSTIFDDIVEYAEDPYDEFMVNTYTTNRQDNPSLAALSDGGFVVTWQSEGQPGDPSLGIYAQIFNADGTKSGSEFRVNTITADKQEHAKVRAFTDGGFIVTFEGTPVSGEIDKESNIYFRRFNNNGTAIDVADVQVSDTVNAIEDTAGNWREGSISTSYLGQQQFPEVVELYNQGTSTALGFLITWSTCAMDTDNSLCRGTPTTASVSPDVSDQEYNVFGRFYDASGSRITTATDGLNMTTAINSNQKWGYATARDDGGFLFTWTQSYLENRAPFQTINSSPSYPTNGILGRRYDYNGSTWVSESTENWDGTASVNTSATVSPDYEFQINSTSDDYQSYSPSARLNDGGFVTAWTSRNQGETGNKYNIFAQRYNSDGTVYGSEFQVNTYTTDDQRGVYVSALSNGGFFITWKSYNQDFSGAGGWGLYGQKYSSTSIKTGSEFRINNTEEGEQYYGAHDLLKNGNTAIAWVNSNPADTDAEIYAKVIKK